MKDLRNPVRKSVLELDLPDNRLCRVLEEIPISGTEAEVVFGSESPGRWVEFETRDFEKWFGVFPQGENGEDGLLRTSGENEVFVISGGLGYWINLDQRKAYFPADEGLSCDILDAVYCPALDCVIAAGTMSIVVYGREGPEWESGTIAMDIAGILRLEETVVTFVAEDYEYNRHQFQFDAASREIKNV